LNASQLLDALRAFDPPIIARVEGERVLIDLRTVFPEQDELVGKALERIAG
jgi:L-seryl-tRNA(Ser) seleniumtransferase